ELGCDLLHASLMEQQDSRNDGFGHALSDGPAHIVGMEKEVKMIRHVQEYIPKARRMHSVSDWGRSVMLKSRASFSAASEWRPITRAVSTSAKAMRPAQCVRHWKTVGIKLHMLATKVGAKVAVFGYARVSTDGQTLASQDAELMAAG